MSCEANDAELAFRATAEAMLKTTKVADPAAEDEDPKTVEDAKSTAWKLELQYNPRSN